jgi:transcriptional regulator with XRE-family HTH domain
MAAGGWTPGDEPQPLDPGRSNSPTVLRIVIGTQLRRLREAHGISRETAGDAIRASHAKISRLELGRVGFKERDVADLLDLYGVVDRDEREAFLRLVRDANTPGWWHRYSDVLPGWFEMYVRLEQAASVIRSYQVQFVPGLFQTEEYARAVITSDARGESRDEVERRVHLRMTRQKLLTEPHAPTFWAVLDEAALRRPYGSGHVLRAQLEHLVALGELPNVTLQVLRFDDAASAAAGPFTVLRFAEPDLPDIVYIEQLTSAVYLDKQADVEHYRAAMDRIATTAASPSESSVLLSRLAHEL